MDLFLIKKVITVFIMPINIVLLLLLAGLIFRKSRAKFSFRCVSLAVIILLVSSFSPIANRLMASLEATYPPYTKREHAIDYIVVLGCGHTSNDMLPATSELANCSLQRMVEALRIFQLHPESRIITSGYASKDPESNAEKVKAALVLLGVPAHKIINENFPKDTQEEAQLISPRVQDTQFILITNADHMPRSMNYFKAQGVNPIPAPTGYWVKNLQGEKSWSYYIPSSKKLEQTTIAWYEYLGLVAQWVKSIFTN